MSTKTTQEFPFSIINSEDDELYGNFYNIIGLTGNNQINIDEHKYHQLTLEQCYPSDRLKDWCLGKLKGSSCGYQNTKILILNDQLKAIGSYSFIFAEPIQWRLCNPTTGELDIVIVGILMNTALPHTLELWEHWRKGVPIQKNSWATLSFNERRAWLDIVRLYHCHSCQHIQDAPPGSTFELDGTYIVDYPSFFCAMGEAINGPGGYFGTDLNSLNDCRCGGFGTGFPFTLRWHQSYVARSQLDRTAWLRENDARRVQATYELGLDEIPSETDAFDNISLFEGIMSILTEGGVNVKLL
jgi:hypothetical protein